jgi:beta-glucosidase
MNNNLKHHSVLGNDYYITNEHRVAADGHTYWAGEIFGYNEITRQYYDRYRLPVMHTETNLREGPHGDEAVQWLRKQFANVLRVRNSGVPTIGFTWYSLTDQVDWDSALREDNGNVNALGLYDLDRNIRNVGREYRQLIQDWRDVLPVQSECLALPLVLPEDFDAPAAVQRREDMRSHRYRSLIARAGF